jgi:tellurite resistance protein
MDRVNIHAREAAARVLALLVAANGRVDPRELRMLDELDAYGRLQIARERFVELAQVGVDGFGSEVCDSGWMPGDAAEEIDELLAEVDDPALRLLVCRLAAAVITADGCVSSGERAVYDHVLARWHLTQSMVSRAILHDRAR